MRNLGKLLIKKLVFTDALLFRRIICNDQSRGARRLVRFVMNTKATCVAEEVTADISHSRPSIFYAIDYFHGNQSSSLNYDYREYKFAAVRRCYIQNVVYQFDKQVTKANSIVQRQTSALKPEITYTQKFLVCS